MVPRVSFFFLMLYAEAVHVSKIKERWSGEGKMVKKRDVEYMSLRVGHVNVTCFSVTDKFVSETPGHTETEITNLPFWQLPTLSVTIALPQRVASIFLSQLHENGFALLYMQYCEKPRAVTLRRYFRQKQIAFSQYLGIFFSPVHTLLYVFFFLYISHIVFFSVYTTKL